MKKKQFRRFAWGGFTSDKLHADLVDMGFGGFGQSKQASGYRKSGCNNS